MNEGCSREEEFAGVFLEPVRGAGLAMGEEPRQQTALLVSLTFPKEHVCYVFWVWLNKSCALQTQFLHSFSKWCEEHSSDLNMLLGEERHLFPVTFGGHKKWVS